MDNQYNQQIYEHYQTPRNASANELPKVRNGGAWFVVVLPALGIFLETYAVNKWLGMLLWASVILLSPLFCYLDYRDLVKEGNFVGSLKKYIFFPLLYVGFRSKMFNQGGGMAVVYVIFILYAAISNGFSKGYRYDANDFKEYVSFNYVVSVEEFSESNSMGMIDEQLLAFINEEEADYSYKSTRGDRRYVTASGTFEHEGDKNAKLDIVFLIDFDGFAFKEFSIDSVQINGKELEGEAKDELLDTIFLAELEEDKSSSGDDSTSVNSEGVADTGEVGEDI